MQIRISAQERIVGSCDDADWFAEQSNRDIADGRCRLGRLTVARRSGFAVEPVSPASFGFLSRNWSGRTP